MKRTLLALILAVVAFFALSYFTDATGEIIVAPGAARVLLAAALLSLALWLSRIGAAPDEGSGATVVAVLLGVVAAAVAVIVATFVPPMAAELDDDELVRRFRVLYYENQLFKNDYLGIRCLQYPTDQWMMQEIIADIRPDFIVETGTWSGATTLFYAHLLEKLKPEARIITVDIEPHGKNAPRYAAWDERIEFILGDSVSDEVVGSISDKVRGHTVLVTLDSSHATEHVAKELERYSPMVSVGSYIVVQDTHLGGNPNQHPSVDNPGPLPAVLDFLKRNPNFEIDHTREKHMLTQNPSGYLKRVR